MSVRVVAPGEKPHGAQVVPANTVVQVSKPRHRTATPPQGVLRRPVLGPPPPSACERYCSVRLVLLTLITILASLGILLIALDKSPGGTGPRTPGIIMLSMAAVLGFGYWFYSFKRKEKPPEQFQSTASLALSNNCELCKQPLTGMCKQNHEWLKKRRIAAMSDKARERFGRKGETEKFLQSLCPVAVGKCGHQFHYHCLVPYLKSKRDQPHVVCPIGPWVWEYENKKLGTKQAQEVEELRQAKAKEFRRGPAFNPGLNGSKLLAGGPHKSKRAFQRSQSSRQVGSRRVRSASQDTGSKRRRSADSEPGPSSSSLRKSRSFTNRGSTRRSSDGSTGSQRSRSRRSPSPSNSRSASPMTSKRVRRTGSDSSIGSCSKRLGRAGSDASLGGRSTRSGRSKGALPAGLGMSPARRAGPPGGGRGAPAKPLPAFGGGRR